MSRLLNAVALCCMAPAVLGCGAAGPAASPADEWDVCTSCEIAMVDSVFIGDAAGVDGPAWKLGTSLRTVVAVDSRGRLYVSPTYQPGSVSVFSPAGDLLATVGSEGEGPGEFEQTTWPVVGTGDSLYVWDADLGRLSQFGPELDYIRQYQFPFSVEQAIPQADRILVRPTTRQSSPLAPVFAFERADVSDFEELGDATGAATLMAARGHTTYVMSRGRMAIDVYAGGAPQAFVRDPEWLPSGEARDRFTVRSAHVDDVGRMWLLLAYPTPEVEASRPPERGPEGGEILSAADAARRMTYVVEVLDLETRSVVASRTLVGTTLWTQLLPGPRLVGVHEGTNGVAVVEVWKLLVDSDQEM